MGVSTMRGCLPLVCSAILLSTDLSVGQEQCRCLPLRINLNTLVPCPPDRAQPDGRFNSNLTVHAGPGSCKSECKLSTEGYSYCDLKLLLYRDVTWFDWDFCSMCDTKKQDRFYTPFMRECESGSSMGCSNLWRNREHEAPRCMTTEGKLDYCTTCVPEKGSSSSECPPLRLDNIPGSIKGAFGMWPGPQPSDDVDNV